MQMVVWGEPPWPPSITRGCCGGGGCAHLHWWLVLEDAGDAGHGKGHIATTTVSLRCLLQHFGLLHCDEEEGKNPLGVNRVSRPRCRTEDLLCHSGVPPGRNPLLHGAGR